MLTRQWRNDKMELYEGKGHRYYKGLIPSKFPQDYIFCFEWNSTGDHRPVTVELAAKHFEAEMGVASGRQGQGYGIVTIALKKGFTDPRTGIRYNEIFWRLSRWRQILRVCTTRLTLVVAYTMHACSDPTLGLTHNACGYNSTQLANFFESCDIRGVPRNVVFEDNFDQVVYQHSMYQARGHLLYGFSGQA